ncbi:hypothetical protein GCM10017790_29270 [Amycolatopsis oliviviridis]|uniref:Uncharacterized protein n=1 Tax=Amycolatopsis oliviviridis TaxID=1471590 RepID=A0ABQ3LJQ2_9PSEU|nr:hypothetical protein GCM10017790_29270 [Amycolatopsis oliviviridis]
MTSSVPPAGVVRGSAAPATAGDKAPTVAIPAARALDRRIVRLVSGPGTWGFGSRFMTRRSRGRTLPRVGENHLTPAISAAMP